MSAIVTTLGVGELSALNAIAGASAELVPIIHIVGFSSTAIHEKKLPVHHTLADGDFELFMKMSERISAAAVLLKDPLEATRMIDETITDCYRSSKPVYIGLPMDLVQAEIDTSPLEKPMLLRPLPTNSTAAEETAVNKIREILIKAESPVIIVDSLAGRYEGLHVTRSFVEKSNIPCFSFPMAKGIINESLPNFRGIYAGDVSNPGVQKAIQSSDLILLIGSRPSDLNTGAFKSDVPDVGTIVFHRDTVKLGEETYSNILMENVLGDIVAMDAGTSAFGGIWSQHPRGAQSLFQLLWCSIGFALGATVGAAIAAREQFKESETKQKRRTILFTGDGSLQMTAQEISTLVRQELGVVIFVICNDGYTIERFIHGWEKSYNDIQPWDYRLLPQVFSPKPDSVRTYSVRTRGELEAILTDDQFGPAGNFNEEQPEPLRLVEVHMDKHDAPQTIPDMITALHGKIAT